MFCKWTLRPVILQGDKLNNQQNSISQNFIRIKVCAIQSALQMTITAYVSFRITCVVFSSLFTAR